MFVSFTDCLLVFSGSPGVWINPIEMVRRLLSFNLFVFVSYYDMFIMMSLTGLQSDCFFVDSLGRVLSLCILYFKIRCRSTIYIVDVLHTAPRLPLCQNKYIRLESITPQFLLVRNQTGPNMEVYPCGSRTVEQWVPIWEEASQANRRTPLSFALSPLPLAS